MNASRADAMPGASWAKLIRQKRERALYRITLLVRGKVVVKEYTNEDEYRKWREAYQEQMQNKEVSGIEDMQVGVVYR